MENPVKKYGFFHLAIQKIRFTFMHPFSKEVRIFLVFLLLSFLFWWLQSLQEIREISVRIPVIYNEVSSDITVTNVLPNELTITVSDKGTNLYRYIRHRKDLTLTLNVMDYYKGQDQGEVPLSEIQSLLNNKLMASSQVIRVNPERIHFHFAKEKAVRLPVRLSTNLHFAPQHQLSSPLRLSPSTVMAYAPEKVLKNLQYIDTETLEIKDLKDTTEVYVVLKPIQGLRLAQNKVKVLVCVEEFTEKSINLPVNGVGFPSGSSLLSFPDHVKISFFVGLSAYNQIKPSDFEAVVDYQTLMSSTNNRSEVRLSRQPIGIHNVRIQPGSVECLVEKNNR
jgi:hypothetical protein